jgi:coenzyme F420-dependent glucose-6-phosphate dehydrogenase
VADGFICTSGKGMALYAETLLPAVRESAEKAGRSLSGIDLTIEMKVSFDHDRQRALEDTRHWAALALSQEEKVGVDDAIEMERRAAALPVERAASRWIVSTDPDEHVEQIKPYLKLGFNHLIFHAPGPDQKRFLKVYGQEVLPRLRELAAHEAREAPTAR